MFKERFVCSLEMEASDSNLRNEVCCVIKFCYRLGKKVPKTINNNNNKAYKDKCFGKSTIFRRHSDFKKGHFSAKN